MRLLSVTIVVAMAIAGQSSAQDTSGGATELDVIVVDGGEGKVVKGYRVTRAATATKTGTPVRDVPQSIQVIPRDVMRDQNAIELSDAVTNASGVVPGNTRAGQAETFLIRGFATPQYAENGIVINPLGDRPETVKDLANVERIEVLKGPASVLYGRGEPGGLVNVITRQPEFDRSTDVSVEAGTGQYYRTSASTTGALNDDQTLAGRLTFAAQTKDGFRDDVFTNAQRLYFAPSLLWTPDEQTRAFLNFEYVHQKVPFDRGLVAIGDRVTLPADFELGESYSRQTTDRASATWGIEHDLSDQLTLRHIGNLSRSVNDRFSVDPRDVSEDGTTLSRRVSDSEERLRGLDLQFEAIGTFDTGSIGHKVLMGYEYTRSSLDLVSSRAPLASLDLLNPVYGAQPGDFSLNQDLDSDSTLHSVYLQDQIELTDGLKILAGGRLDHVAQDQDDTGARSSQNDTALTPRVGVVYQPWAPLSIYASYSQSFRPQLGSTRSGESFDPQTGRQYEAGIKYDIIPDQLSATLAVFDITKQNVPTEDPLDSDFSILTGEQRVRGVELDISGEILPGWNMVLAGAYLDSEVTQDEIIALGNSLEGVPTLSGRIWTTYQIQEGSWEGLGVGGGLLAVGSRKGDIDNSFEVAGYVRADGTIFYDWKEGTRLSLNFKNIGNISYIESVAGRSEVVPGDPFTVTARMNVTF